MRAGPGEKGLATSDNARNGRNHWSNQMDIQNYRQDPKIVVIAVMCVVLLVALLTSGISQSIAPDQQAMAASFIDIIEQPESEG